jgi:hypothetical protein
MSVDSISPEYPKILLDVTSVCVGLKSSAPSAASLLLINESFVTHRLRDDHSLDSDDFQLSKEVNMSEGIFAEQLHDRLHSYLKSLSRDAEITKSRLSDETLMYSLDSTEMQLLDEEENRVGDWEHLKNEEVRNVLLPVSLLP